MKNKELLISFFLLVTQSLEAQQFASELQISSEETTFWYRICSAVPDMQDYAMTDCSNKDLIYQVQLLHTTNDDEHSQWKLTAVGKDGKVVLVNRATGLLLGGKSLNQGNHNPTSLIVNSFQGYTINPLGDNAFSLQGVEDDGVERCLALAKRDTPAILWPEENLSASVIGWKFMPVTSSPTGISEINKKTVINVADRRVFVEGCSKWQLFTLNGEEIPSNTILTAGVYLVKTPDGVVKVVVQ